MANASECTASTHPAVNAASTALRPKNPASFRLCQVLACSLLLLGMVSPVVVKAQADESRPANSLDLELSAFRFNRNDVRIPSDEGTKFALDKLTGANGATARLHGTWWLNDRNALRLTLAPLNASGTAVPDQDIAFAGENFEAGLPTRAEYRFNTYRLTWRYRLLSNERWDWSAGAAVLVRDARIRLTQGALSAQDDDLGLVPLLHAHVRYRLAERTTLVLDFEGAWAPQGRAFDVGLRAEQAFSDRWYGHVGLRSLEGGADNSNVYAFAWVNFATLGVGYRF